MILKLDQHCTSFVLLGTYRTFFKLQSAVLLQVC